ncbi:E-selectin [Holothuria leucospilota]|uniref:E-selectin n=1 Tax=Holothuria leucospilota TaxID=206669 RepID=A0A9Q1BKU7_HOLLE|nr:E-selectin [Holothuria leucospilota]
MYSMCETEGPYKHPVGLIAYLADVQSQAENDFIAQNVTGGARAWLGAERVGDDFRWIANVRNGNEEPGLSYTNWKQNEPNNSSGDEDCIEINRGRAGAGTWNDLKCKRKISGVCKYSISEWIEGRE